MHIRIGRYNIIFRVFKQRYGNMNGDGVDYYRWITQLRIYSYKGFMNMKDYYHKSWYLSKYKLDSSFSSVYSSNILYNGEKAIAKSLKMMFSIVFSIPKICLGD